MTKEYAQSGAFAGPYLEARLATELVAVCRGLLMDGAVVDREIVELNRWCDRNPVAARNWPGDVLVERLRRILSDGRVDEDERRDLHLFLEEMTGYRGGVQEPEIGIYTEPPPELVIIGETFTLTGVFLFGTRRAVTTAIEEIGGAAIDHIKASTDYLLVGSRAAPAWLHGTRGTKIDEAVERNRQAALGRCKPLPIVSEKHWSRYLYKPEGHEVDQ